MSEDKVVIQVGRTLFVYDGSLHPLSILPKIFEDGGETCFKELDRWNEDLTFLADRKTFDLRIFQIPDDLRRNLLDFAKRKIVLNQQHHQPATQVVPPPHLNARDEEHGSHSVGVVSHFLLIPIGCPATPMLTSPGHGVESGAVTRHELRSDIYPDDGTKGARE